jgi:acylglycerol lipase
MTTREGRFAGGRLYYRAWEAPSPHATVVLAHGYAEHSGRYEHVGDALAAAGFTTWALDHAGHGQSEGERASVGTLAGAVEDLDAFVDAVLEEGAPQPVFLLGHSMGGLISTAYAEKHQDRLKGLALTGPAVAVNEALAALQEMDEIPVIDLSPLVSRDPAIVADYQNDPLNFHGPMPRTMITAMLEIAGVRDRLGDISIPVLVMHGEDDGLVPAQASRDIAEGVSATDVTLKIWPGLYHEILNEPERNEVIAVLRDWLEAHV